RAAWSTRCSARSSPTCCRARRCAQVGSGPSNFCRRSAARPLPWAWASAPEAKQKRRGRSHASFSIQCPARLLRSGRFRTGCRGCVAALGAELLAQRFGAVLQDLFEGVLARGFLAELLEGQRG